MVKPVRKEVAVAQCMSRFPRVLFVVAIACPTAVAEGPYPFRLPEGFSVERVAGPPEIQFPMFAALDDRGRLFVAESSGLDLYAELTNLTRKCRISVLEDRDGDGRYGFGSVYPYLPSERFVIYQDTVAVRARWPNEGNDIRLR